MMFGITGIFIGPLIASLFVTIWELYGLAFSDYLPEVHRGKSASGAASNAGEESGG
jgi:predicted PurR-regulated permease PerM